MVARAEKCCESADKLKNLLIWEFVIETMKKLSKFRVYLVFQLDNLLRTANFAFTQQCLQIAATSCSMSAAKCQSGNSSENELIRLKVFCISPIGHLLIHAFISECLCKSIAFKYVTRD